MIKKFTMVMLVTGLAACGGENSDSATVTAAEPRLSTCFWNGPYVKENPAANFAYPDSGAAYWTAEYSLPEGATLKLDGEFPYSRYISYNSYRSDGSPADVIADNNIVPEQGAVNPFVNGNPRQGQHRGYQIEVAAGSVPEDRAENTLYDNAEEGKSILMYRIYVPDEGKGILGGVELPEVTVTTADGVTHTGDAACEQIDAQQKLVQIPRVPEEAYAQARQNNPARVPPIWQAIYNFQWGFECGFYYLCDTDPVRQVGWYANLDNQYMSSFLDKSIKPVVVIRGKIPATPKTLGGDEYFDTSEAQLRYWSICQNEYYSQRVEACLYDEQITINPDGKFTIVTSTEADRPENASEQCGVGFLPWPENGDGFSIEEGREDHADDALVIVRNMQPMNGFDQAIQDTQKPGDEAEVLGEYLPSIEYFTTEEFEALGCDAYNAL